MATKFDRSMRHSFLIMMLSGAVGGVGLTTSLIGIERVGVITHSRQAANRILVQIKFR